MRLYSERLTTESRNIISESNEAFGKGGGSMDKATHVIPVVSQIFSLGQRQVRRYVGLMPHRLLFHTAQADVRSERNPTGYQREREIRRCRALANHYMKGGQAADGITLNVRVTIDGQSPLTFREGAEPGFGYLEVQSGSKPFWIIDGQHRIYSYEFFPASDLLFPVTIYEGLSKTQETMLFVYINDRQKRMKTDLALALLADLKRAGGNAAPWKQLAVELVRRLDQDSDSPWFGQINETGSRGSKRAVNLASFVSSLRRMLDPVSPFSDLDTEQQVRVLKAYWKAIAEVFPDAWEVGKAKKSHLLSKTLGVYVMHLLAAEHVFKVVPLKSPFVSAVDFVAILQSLVGTDWWSTKAGEFRAMNSMKGFQEAARMLRRELVGDTVSDEEYLWDALRGEEL